jgi:D,D-heptose 1,7-bisphosphate phosphatase
MKGNAMSHKCVFLDRDRTLIEDPGYLSEAESVRLLPGVDQALRSLAEAGFKLVVITNQAGVARGLLSEEDLERVHGELRRQLAERDVHLEAIYYCPFHPDGTVEEYARESIDRKPQPGMLLRAAKELALDLPGSWMIGDSPRDVEAGQRAGCRTIRLRATRDETAEGVEKREVDLLDSGQDEGAQADFTVRNIVDAARVILRGADGSSPVGAAAREAVGAGPAVRAAVPLEAMTEGQLLREIVAHLRGKDAGPQDEEFSYARLGGALFQILALLALVVGAAHIPGSAGEGDEAYVRLATVYTAFLAGLLLKLIALTFFLLARRK